MKVCKVQRISFKQLEIQDVYFSFNIKIVICLDIYGFEFMSLHETNIRNQKGPVLQILIANLTDHYNRESRASIKSVIKVCNTGPNIVYLLNNCVTWRFLIHKFKKIIFSIGVWKKNNFNFIKFLSTKGYASYVTYCIVALWLTRDIFSSA